MARHFGGGLKVEFAVCVWGAAVAYCVDSAEGVLSPTRRRESCSSSRCCDALTNCLSHANVRDAGDFRAHGTFRKLGCTTPPCIHLQPCGIKFRTRNISLIDIDRFSKLSRCSSSSSNLATQMAGIVNQTSQGSAASLADVMDFAGTDKAESLTLMVRHCLGLHPFTQHQHPAPHCSTYLQP